MFNYKPEDQGVWVKYNRWRYKDVHHVRLKDGREVKFVYPNGGGWYADMGCTGMPEGGIRDEMVDEIMLATDEDINSVGGWREVGPERIAMNRAMFGEYIPE